MPTSSGWSSIHTTIASKAWATRGWLSDRTIMSPRLASTSSARVSVADIGANASSTGPSGPSTCLTVVVFREGSTVTSSPGRTTPEASVPANPRKSRFGRETSCTGKRMSTRLRSLPMNTVSRMCISVPPSYQGVCSLGFTTLSPSSADIGTKRMSGRSSFSTKRV